MEIASLPLDGQGPDRGTGIEQKQTAATAPSLFSVEIGRLGNFSRGRGKKALHKISFLCNTRFAFPLPSPAHSTEPRRKPVVPVSRLSLSLSSYRYASKRSCHVREGLQSIGMGSVKFANATLQLKSYQRMRRNIRKGVLGTLPKYKIEMDASCEACDGKLSCSVLRRWLFSIIHSWTQRPGGRERSCSSFLCDATRVATRIRGKRQVGIGSGRQRDPSRGERK